VPRAARTAFLVAVLAALAGAAVPAAGRARPNCFPPHTRTVWRTASVRVYYDRTSSPFGCLIAHPRPVSLDRYVDPYYAPGDAHLGQLRLAGQVLGYTWIDPGIPAVYVHSVNLRTGRMLRRTEVQPVAVFDPSAVAVTALVVRPDGALGWIQRLEGEISVWRLDRRGLRRLDVGPRIALRSLGLRRTRLTWRDRGRRRTASLL